MDFDVLRIRLPDRARRLRPRSLTFLAAALIGLLSVLAGPGLPATLAQGTVPRPDWLEPRGLSIVDLVGEVPEEHLRDAIISWETQTGMLQYVSGERSGNTVRITAKVTPRYGPSWTTIGCLGQWPVYDQWPTAAPSGTLRLYANGQEITQSIIQVSVIRSALVQPPRGSADYPRYVLEEGPLFSVPQPVQVPANMGCKILVGGGRYSNLTAVFTLNAPKRVTVDVLGSRSWQARSYIGEGENGSLSGLAGQMAGRYGDRHDKFGLDAPSGTDYMLFKFPPTPLDPYASVDPANAGLAGSGTWRLERSVGGLSVDHVNTAGIPIGGQWQDSDQARGRDFLPFLQPIVRVASPEYFLPPGVPYDPCMSSGNCPDSVLERVHSATFPVTAYFYRVQLTTPSQLAPVLLRQVGSAWSGSAASPADVEAAYAASDAAAVYPAELEQASGADARAASPFQEGQVWLPLISGQPVTYECAEYPCGWFDAQGRMYDFIAAP